VTEKSRGEGSRAQRLHLEPGPSAAGWRAGVWSAKLEVCKRAGGCILPLSQEAKMENSGIMGVGG
jgi:hypothetical protein